MLFLRARAAWALVVSSISFAAAITARHPLNLASELCVSMKATAISICDRFVWSIAERMMFTTW